ncbi:MAG: hypothetical protein NT056_11330 [Proteobacteria bacterium]|nr:hypothetical protein [Pseudomonadota bacterium]
MLTLEKLLEVVKVFNAAGVKYILVGGWAVILHGLERTTMDMDILVEASDENIGNLRKALGKFLKPGEISDLTAGMVREYGVVRVGLGDFYIDVITKIGKMDYQRAESGIHKEIIDNVAVPVAGLETMIEMKKGVREIDKKDRLFLEGKKDFLKKPD